MTVLKSFVGPPLNQQFINCYNFGHEQSLEAVKYFLQTFQVSKKQSIILNHFQLKSLIIQVMADLRNFLKQLYLFNLCHIFLKHIVQHE